MMIDVSNLDDEPSLVSSEQEPEAWSVTVDLKTLKKMTAKNIKRQDHIWGQWVTVFIDLIELQQLSCLNRYFTFTLL